MITAARAAVEPTAAQPARVPVSTSAPDEESSGGLVRQATFREVFAVREFRPLFGSFLLSTIGDELARVALTVLVYQRTESPLLAAVTFAIGHLPWLLGGPLLSTLADRLPRHRVLIATDAARAVLVALMAIPGTPLPILLGLLFLIALCAPPFESARSALMADVLEGDQYAVATSLSNISLQLAQVIGFVAAGALVAVFNPSTALLVDAATFAISAVWLWARLKRRPAPLSEAGEGPRSLWQDAVDGLQFIGRTPRLLAIVAVLWLGTMFAFASEGVAAPLADELGQATTAVGLLLAANPLGATIGGLVIARLIAPDRRDRLVPPLVVLTLLPVLVAGLVGLIAGPGDDAVRRGDRADVRLRPRLGVGHPAQRVLRAGGAERLPGAGLRRRGQRPVRGAGHRRAGGGPRRGGRCRRAASSPCPAAWG